MLTTAYDYECSSSTLGTLERCQRPVPVSSSKLVLVLDGLGAGVESTVTQVVIQTHIGSGNACNVKIGTYPVHLGVDPAGYGAVLRGALHAPVSSTFEQTHSQARHYCV